MIPKVASVRRTAAGALPKAPVTLGRISLSFHEASAAIVAQVMRNHGQTVVFSEALHEEMFDRLRRGEVDLLCSAWLPGSHGTWS